MQDTACDKRGMGSPHRKVKLDGAVWASWGRNGVNSG